MLILAIETSSRVSGAALSDGKKILASLMLETGLEHSASLLPNIDTLLKIAGKDRADLTAVAVSIGPGSFTGLRIGLGAAKGIAYGLSLPLIAVPTLPALAARFPYAGYTVAALCDAQKNNAYCGFYRWDGQRPVALVPVAVASLDEVLAKCARFDCPVIAAGDIALKRLAGRDDLPKNLTIAPRHFIMPHPDTVAWLGAAMAAAGETVDPMMAEPWYLRRSEAEELWEIHHPEQKINGR